MKKPFVIAEVGSNWKNFNDAKESIQHAKVAGADAVKFQLFTHEELYGVKGDSLSSYELDPSWLPLLKEKADSAGIEFMCSAFSEAGVEIVDKYVKRHKLASSENNHLHLISAMLKTKKPLILSCGGSSIIDIEKTLAYIEKNFGKNLDITLLYCVSNYPCRMHNLFNITKLKYFGYKVGLSDHSTDVLYTPISAVYHFGIEVLEKHFRLDRIKDTPDANHSLTVDEFKFMVKSLSIDPISEDLPFRSREEKQAVLRYNRRLIATKYIKRGAKFDYGSNYGAFRSLKDDANGLGPDFPLDSELAARDLIPGDSIGPKDFQ